MCLGIIGYLQKKGPGQKKTTSAEVVVEALEQKNFPGVEPEVATKMRQVLKDVRAHPNSAGAWGKLAMNLDVHDWKNEAIVCYQKAAALNASDFRWPYYAGIVLYESGSPEAISYFQRSISLSRQAAPAHLRLGFALLDARRFDDASHEFQSAVELDPQSSNAYLGLARIALTRGDVKQALDDLMKAQKANPAHAEVHGLLSEIYRRMNQQEAARQQFLISQQLPKKNPIPDKWVAQLEAEGVGSFWHDTRGRQALASGKYDVAIEELKRAVSQAKDPRYYDELGAAYLNQNRFAEAAEQFQQSLKLNPRSIESLNNFAESVYQLGRKEEAFSILNRALAVDASRPFTYLHLARLRLRENDPAGAIEALKRGNERLTQNPDIAIQLAWLLATTPQASLRNGRDAVRLAEMACAQNMDVGSLNVLAAAYAEAGQFDLAVKAGERAKAMAISAGRQDIAQQLEIPLRSYRAKKPIHE